MQQQRPVLVVAVPNAPGTPALLWVLMVTSAADRGWPGDVIVSDLHAAGLPAVSVVRAAKIATIEERDTERIGQLSPSDRTQVMEALQDSLVRVFNWSSTDIDDR